MEMKYCKIDYNRRGMKCGDHAFSFCGILTCTEEILILGENKLEV